MTFGDAAQADEGKQSSVGGDLLVLVSGLCYAGYTVSVWRTLFLMKRETGQAFLCKVL